jgi:hypothetical protein
VATVGLPLTGAGDATALVAVDTINGEAFQRVKLFDGTLGSTVPITAKATTPDAADGAMVVRPIGSTAFNQAVVGSVGLTSGSSAVGITSGSSAVELTSAGSTRLAGRFTLENPTTLVDLGSGGSTKVIGTVNATGTTKVDVTSGVVLGAGSSANVLGSVTLSAVTTAITVGSVAILPGVSTMGSVQQGAGSSGNFWFTQTIPFSSANLARTTVNTTVDISVIAANANRKGLVIANLSTVQIVGLGLSTGAVTTGLTNVNVFLSPNSQLTFGCGGLPLFTGPIRGINISSTAIAGGVAVMEFT